MNKATTAPTHLDAGSLEDFDDPFGDITPLEYISPPEPPYWLEQARLEQQAAILHSLQAQIAEPLLYHEPAKEIRAYFALLTRDPNDIVQAPAEYKQRQLPDGTYEMAMVKSARAYPRTVQRCYPVDQLPDVLNQIDRNIDAWVSMAEFTRPNRRVVNLFSVPALWVDLDIYKMEFNSQIPHICQGPEWSAEDVCRFLSYRGLPLPSVILHSGRGLQAKWLLDQNLPAAAYPRWRRCQTQLVDLLKDYAADPACVDGSRVLRLEHTINTKSEEYTRVVWPPAGQPVARYSFEKLADELLPFTRDEIAQLRAERVNARQLRIANEGDKPRQRPAQLLTQRSLWWARLADIRQLRFLRGWTTVPTGHRDIFVFLACLAFSWGSAHRPGLDLWNEFACLTRELVGDAWSTAELRSRVTTLHERARRHAAGELDAWNGKDYSPLYRYRNDSLIQLLEITPEEQRKLSTLISKGIRKERDAAGAQKRRQAAGAVTRETYLLNAEQKRIEARLRRSRGESIRQIAEALGCSTGAVQHYLK